MTPVRSRDQEILAKKVRKWRYFDKNRLERCLLTSTEGLKVSVSQSDTTRGWFRPLGIVSCLLQGGGYERLSALCFHTPLHVNHRPRAKPPPRYFKCTAKYALTTNTMTGTPRCHGITISSFVAACPGSFVRLGGTWRDAYFLDSSSKYGAV